MIPDNLIDAVRSLKKSGQSDEAISQKLRESGWDDKDIKEVFDVLSNASSVPTKAQPVPSSTSESPPVQAVSENIISDEAIDKNEALKKDIRDNNGKPKYTYLIIGLIAVILIGASAFAYTKGIFSFGGAPYKGLEVINIGLGRASEIKSSSDTFEWSFRVEERESNAQPLVIDITELNKKIEEARPLYKRDSKRFTNLKDIVSKLRFSQFSNTNTNYPRTLSELSLLRPIPDDIKNSFSYIQTNNGKGYELSVAFETEDAVRTIEKRSGYSTETENVKINDKTAVFTEEQNYIYYYFSSEPPKPAIVEIIDNQDEFFAMFPKEIDVSIRIKSETDLGGEEFKENNLSSKATIEIDTILGDASYSFSVDILVHESSVYFKINKFPGIPFLSAFFDPSKIKGIWVKISEEDLSSVYGSTRKSFAEETQDETEKAIKMYKKLLQIAQEEKLVKVSSGPKKEDVNGTKAFRYSLALNKESIVPFTERMTEEINSWYQDAGIVGYPYPSALFNTSDKDELIEFFESDEFATLFDYWSENMAFNIWFSKNGMPIKISQKTKIVPSDGVIALKDVQYISEISHTIENINEDIKIKPPKDFMTFEDAQELLFGNSPLMAAREKAQNASIRASLTGVRASAELYYDGNNSSYGLAVKETDCVSAEQKNNTLFKDSYVKNSFDSARKSLSDDTDGICAASNTSYAMAFPLIPISDISEGTYFCIDSSGYATNVIGEKEEDVIVGTGSGGNPYSCNL